MLEANLKFDIIQVRDHRTREQKKHADKLITEYGLKVFSYPPAHVYLIGDENELSAVYEYATGMKRISMVRDIIEGTKCIAELDGQRLNRPPKDWDLNIVGSRADDVHYTGEKPIPSKEWDNFYAPFFDRTREEILAIARAYGVPTEKEVEEGDIEFCTKCLRGPVICPKDGQLVQIDWDPVANLKQFRDSHSV